MTTDEWPLRLVIGGEVVSEQFSLLSVKERLDYEAEFAGSVTYTLLQRNDQGKWIVAANGVHLKGAPLSTEDI